MVFYPIAHAVTRGLTPPTVRGSRLLVFGRHALANLEFEVQVGSCAGKISIRDRAPLGVRLLATLPFVRTPAVGRHHLRFVQPRALGRRVSDEFAVPLCRTHHRVLHNRGDEAAWWKEVKLDPVPIARKLWETIRLAQAPRNRQDGVLQRSPTCRRNQP
jgi:hypothetical protein